MIGPLSPAASWGLLLCLVCAVVTVLLVAHRLAVRRYERSRPPSRPIANRYFQNWE